MTVQDFPLNTQLGVFNNEQELANWLLYQDITSYYPYDYIQLIQYAPFIYTNFTQECLVRYNMQKSGYKNFSEVLDDVPAWWIDIYNLMESEAERAQKLKGKLNG